MIFRSCLRIVILEIIDDKISNVFYFRVRGLLACCRRECTIAVRIFTFDQLRLRMNVNVQLSIWPAIVSVIVSNIVRRGAIVTKSLSTKIEIIVYRLLLLPLQSWRLTGSFLYSSLSAAEKAFRRRQCKWTATSWRSAASVFFFAQRVSSPELGPSLSCIVNKHY